MSRQIYIVTGPVQSGKSTTILKNIQSNNSLGGILTIDRNGKRELLEIKSKKYHRFQILNEEINNQDIITIGKFTFEKDAFDRATQIILKDLSTNSGPVIIDELGKLELKGEGLHEVITASIKAYRSGTFTHDLIILIRDYLLDDAIRFYNLDDGIVVTLDQISQLGWE